MKLSAKECLDKFVWYDVKSKRGGSYMILRGIQLEKGYLHKIVDLCEFKDKRTKVPKNAVKKKVDKKMVKELFCHEPIPFPSLNGLEDEKWVKQAEKKAITKATIEKMKPGDKIELLPLDRNLYDIIEEDNKPNQLYKPTYFFRKNKVVFKKIEGSKGMIKWGWNKKFEPFELQVEWEKFNWYPLIDEVLPAKNIQTEQRLLGKNMSWNQLPLKIKVGWRGPMIKWSDVKKMPSLFWYQR